MSDIAIKASNVGKLYRLGQIGTGTISHDLNRWWARVRGKEDPFTKIGEINDRAASGAREYVWALKDVNFEIRRGEAVGIIGRNGAGKSTLLKLLSKVTKPTTGEIKLNGRIASLLEVGTGFHPEMTGRENIYLNGAILGMTKKEIDRKFDEIVDFSGVEPYIDTPVKRYSSGMYVRLAFAVAAHLESEILIVDEVLAVGDAEFQKKCLGKMGDVSRGEGRTVLFVSHDLDSVATLCKNGILLEEGSIAVEGPVREIISRYLSSKRETVFYRRNQENKKVYISSVRLTNEGGSPGAEYNYDEPVFIRFEVEGSKFVETAGFFVTILDYRKRRVFSCEKANVERFMVLRIEPKTLVRGDYSIHAFINQPKIEQVDVVEDICSFRIIDSASYLSKHGNYDYGQVFGRYSWL